MTPAILLGNSQDRLVGRAVAAHRWVPTPKSTPCSFPFSLARPMKNHITTKSAPLSLESAAVRTFFTQNELSSDQSDFQCENSMRTHSTPLPNASPRRSQFYYEAIDRALEKIQERHPGRGVHIVGHSIGGWVARAWLAEGCSPTDRENMLSLTTLGTPNTGPPEDAGGPWTAVDQTRGLLKSINTRFPGAHVEGVRYTSVAGTALEGEVWVLLAVRWYCFRWFSRRSLSRATVRRQGRGRGNGSRRASRGVHSPYDSLVFVCDRGIEGGLRSRLCWICAKLLLQRALVSSTSGVS